MIYSRLSRIIDSNKVMAFRRQRGLLNREDDIAKTYIGLVYIDKYAVTIIMFNRN